jgi:O-methyltransferase involved in polyketide biosynthesis
VQRRAPLINRGYFSRVFAIEKVVEAFIRLHAAAAVEGGGGEEGSGGGGGGVRAGDAAARSACQVVSLGAGLDSLYFRLRERGVEAAEFLELDLSAMSLAKGSAIRRSKALREALRGDVSISEDLEGGARVDAEGYHVRTCDLRDLGSVEQNVSMLDRSLPTLFLSECVLVYLEPGDSNSLLRWVARTFSTAVAVTYEQIRPNDAFGRVMCENLAARGAPLRGLQAHPDIPSQVRRFLACAWTHVSVLDMNDVYESVIPAADRARIARIEPFDEIEEWRLMQGHYALTIAIAVRPAISDSSASEPESTPSAAATTSIPTTPPSAFPAGHVVSDAAAGFEFDASRDPPLARLLFPLPLAHRKTATA